MLVDMVLLRLVSTMQSEVVQVNILQEFPVPETIFEDGLEGTGPLFSGASVLNYLLVSAPPRHSCTPAINMRTGRSFSHILSISPQVSCQRTFGSETCHSNHHRSQERRSPRWSSPGGRGRGLVLQAAQVRLFYRVLHVA